jgi:hypothetical protein
MPSKSGARSASAHTKSRRPALPRYGPTHTFTLILSGASELTIEIQDALFEAGCDDALLGCRDGVLFLDFDREAASLQKAIASTIADVEAADIGLRVVRVEPDDLITTSEIARRIGQSRESIRLYAHGQRGPGGFPPPISGIKRRSPLYRWTEVAGWLAQNTLLGNDSTVDEAKRRTLLDAHSIGTINAMLDLRRQVSGPRAVAKLWRALHLSPAASVKRDNRG